MVEGGETLLRSFIEYGLWDEARIEESRIVIGNGVRSPEIRGIHVGYEEIRGNRIEKVRPLKRS